MPGCDTDDRIMPCRIRSSRPPPWRRPRLEVFERADRRAQDRDAQFLAEQGTGAVDVGHIAQHPRSEADRVERQPVARQRRLALRTADQVIPVIAIKVLPRDLDELVQVHERYSRISSSDIRGTSGLVASISVVSLAEPLERGNNGRPTVSQPEPRQFALGAARRYRYDATRDRTVAKRRRRKCPIEFSPPPATATRPCRLLTTCCRRAMSWSPPAWPAGIGLVEDTEFYIGAGQYKHGPEFLRAGAEIEARPDIERRLHTTISKRRAPSGCRSATMAVPMRPQSPSMR